MGHFYKTVVTILPLNTNSEFKERKKSVSISELLETEDKISL